jgi:hypothetical protein
MRIISGEDPNSAGLQHYLHKNNHWKLQCLESVYAISSFGCITVLATTAAKLA